MDAESNSDKAVSTPETLGRFAAVIERAPLPMVEVEGPRHVVCSVNPAFCRLLQRKSEELLGKSFADIVSNGATCIALLDRVYQTGDFETQVVPDESEPAATTYWLYAMWPALDEKRHAVRVIIQMTRTAQFRQNTVAINEALLIGGLRQHKLREEAEQLTARLQIEIAERKRAEEALLAAQAELRAHASNLEQTVAERTAQLRASVGELEAFSYSLVHDLRAPIRAIQGFTQLALEMSREEVGPSAAELLNRVVKAAARMDSLIQDVLSLSQVIRQPIKNESVDVEALVRTLIEERPELAPRVAQIRIDSPLLRMRGHEASLSQCLTNLLGNAVKFVELGMLPQIRVWSEERVVSVKPTAGESVAVLLSRPHDPSTESRMVRLWIEDQGIGIDPAARKRIFEIFQRLHSSSQYEGSGIGLAIVRKAIERMGGRAGVEAAPDKGSRFWLELPKA
jgi:signal transduction histidine kinase